MRNSIEFSWVGSEKHYIDEPTTLAINNISVGRHGGNSAAGQCKNEDGCLVWTSVENDWEFVILLDAHKTAESAKLVLDTFNQNKDRIETVLGLSPKKSIAKMDELVLDIFQNQDFLSSCRNVTGETACLIIFRKDKYIWWFSIGDCVLFLFHPDLNSLGQFQVNQRNFYEWVGQVNTFELSVPCYSSGRRELRKGKNHILMTTDGLIECPGANFDNPKEILEKMGLGTVKKRVHNLLTEIERNNVRDSTTIISWEIDIRENVSLPSDQATN